MSPSTVSVIVSFHDRVAYLGEAVASVLAQDHGPLDVVLVDDGSTDGSADVARSFAPPARVFHQANAGCASAWNVGLRESHGELVAFCDSDDVWAPGRLAPMLAALDAAPGVDAVFGCIDEFVSPELALPDLETRAPRRGAYAPLAGAMLARRSAFARVGPFDETLTQGYWVDWFARLGDVGCTTVAIPDVVMRRRLHRGNSSIAQRDRMGELARALHSSLARRRGRSA